MSAERSPHSGNYSKYEHTVNQHTRKWLSKTVSKNTNDPVGPLSVCGTDGEFF